MDIHIYSSKPSEQHFNLQNLFKIRTGGQHEDQLGRISVYYKKKLEITKSTNHLTEDTIWIYIYVVRNVNA